MSSKSKAGKSAAGGKLVGPVVPEPLPPVTPIPLGTDPKSLPFLEWSDQDLNSEKWDIPKAKDKAKQKPPPPMKKTPSSTPAQFPLVNNPDEPLQFVDPHLVRLPHSLAVHEWKRPSEVFPNANFIMYKESSEYPDLISGSKHLLHSDFMRSFISAIGILEYLGNTRPSPIEFASPTFFPNTSAEPWRPWHHIYSMCKAGKGQRHNPQVNTLGTYVIRLYWMGCWRKVIIDDLLPIDLTKHVLLPTTDVPKPVESTVTPTPIESASKSTVATAAKSGKGSKETSAKEKGVKGDRAEKEVPEIEMWPFLLCKALLKIACLTSTQFDEILDFDIVHCLTGWFVQKIDVTGIDVSDIWDMCAGYSDHFTWPDPTQKPSGGKASKGDKDSKSTSKASKATKSTAGKNVSNFLDGEDSGIIPYHLVATCTDMRTVPENDVPDIAPCWSHHILVDQTRNIPLVKPDPLPELARWKRFRWLAWAIRKGLWPAPELIPIKCFKMVTVFKKCAEHVVYKPPSKEAIDIKKSVAVIEELALEMGDGKQKGGKDKGKKDEKPKASKSTKSDKSSKKGNKGEAAVALPPDPSIWGDFNKLGPYISGLYIFFKSSLFKTNIKITDIAQGVAGKDAGKGKADKGKKGGKTESTGPQLLMWNNELLVSRNEPVYLFLDSIDFKLVVINFAQVGNTDILENTNIAAQFSASMLQEKYLTEAYRPKSSESCILLPDSIDDTQSTFELKACKCSVPFAYVVVENYNWQTSKVGDMTTFLNTYGTKTMLVDVKPGRFVMRIWIKSDTAYSINLMSDTPLVAGTLEVVLENMSHEPESLLKMCHDVSSTYGQLVQKFGTPEFTEALTTFCRSYLPDGKFSKLQLSQVHTVFMKEFVNMIKENCALQELIQRIFALKVLFMNPSIKLEQLEQRCKEIVDNNLSEQLNSDEISQSSEEVQLVKKTERAAVTLQAFFKKLYIRKLKALHSQSHKDYMKIFDSLKKIYADNFSIYKRMVTCPPLIRNFLLSNLDMCNLRDHYPLLTDLNSSIYLQHFTGNVVAPQKTWLPIARYVFYCNSPNTTIIKICLFCGFTKYMVRVLDNDTNKEIKRITNNADVHAYNNNALGYTVLCYGWAENEGNLQWKLDFITLKQKTASLIIVPEVTIHNYILKQNYRPNVNNIICRCVVNISRDALVSFRLSVSYEDVKLYFRCLNEVGQIFGEIYGTESVVLPAILLKYVEGIEEGSESTASSTTQSISSRERKPSRSKLRSGSLARTSTSTSIRKRSKHLERMSLDKYSTSSEKKPRLSRASQEIVKYKDTTYIIEGFVVDDSWPLNKPEWIAVEEVKARSLLGPPIINAFGSLSSSTNFKHSRKSIDFLRKSIDKKKESLEVKPMENPIWCLETISNLEDSLISTVDTRRAEEIKNLKRKWYEDDPERYVKSNEIRGKYLESHFMPLDFTPLSSFDKTPSITSEMYGDYKDETATLIQGGELIFAPKVFPQALDVDKNMGAEEEEDHTLYTVDDICKNPSCVDENVRSLKKPICRTKMLPPLNLENYFRDGIDSKYESLTEIQEEEKVEEQEIDKHIKTPEEEEDLKIIRAQAIADFELDQLCFIEDMHKYISDQVATHKILDVFYKKCRAESKEMMQEAYDLREKVIDIIIEAEKAKLPPPAIGKEKPDKKKKK